MTGQLQQDEVFVIRFWTESERGARPKHWRASIEVLNSRKKFHADGVEEVARLIRTVLRKAAARAR